MTEKCDKCKAVIRVYSGNPYRDVMHQDEQGEWRDGVSGERICYENRIAALSAIISKLPKAADGIPVVPGYDKVFRVADGTGEVEESVNWDGWGVKFISDYDPEDGYYPCRDPSKCYSTKEAAQKAGENQ